MIILGIITSIALCSMNRHFSSAMHGIDVIYTLLARMLSIVMCFMPFASFLAVTDLLFSDGFKGLGRCLAYIIALLVGIMLIFVFYIARLLFSGVNIPSFFKKIWPAVIENLKINSSIDAVPYNTRYCSRVLGINAKTLDNELTLLSQINLDGNCFVLVTVTLFAAYAAGEALTPVQVILTVILIMFLSISAPNQPGSILIGLFILKDFIGMNDGFLCDIILIETFLSYMCNLANTMGDIITVVIDDRKNKIKA